MAKYLCGSGAKSISGEQKLEVAVKVVASRCVLEARSRGNRASQFRFALERRLAKPFPRSIAERLPNNKVLRESELRAACKDGGGVCRGGE